MLRYLARRSAVLANSIRISPIPKPAFSARFRLQPQQVPSRMIYTTTRKLNDDGPGRFAAYKYNIRMKDMLSKGRPDDIWSVLDAMEQDGVAPDIFTYNNVMRAWIHTHEGERLQAVRDEMKERGVEPDSVTYQLLISQAVKEKKFGTAEQLYHEMKQAGKQPTSHTLNCLLSAASMQGKAEQCIQLLQDWNTAGFVPDHFVFQAVIQACIKGTKLQVAWSVFNEMKALNIKPDVSVYSSLMGIASRARRADLAIQLYEELLAAGIEPSLKVYAAMLRAATAQNDVELADKVLATMRERDCIKSMDPRMWKTLLILSCKIGHPERMDRYFEELLKARYMDSQLYYLLLRTCAGLCDHRKAIRYYDRMMKDRTPFTAVAADAMLDCLSVSAMQPHLPIADREAIRNKSLQVMEHLKQNNVKLTRNFLVLLLTAHAGPSNSFALPAPAEMLEMARNFKLDTTPQFQRVLAATEAEEQRRTRHQASTSSGRHVEDTAA